MVHMYLNTRLADWLGQDSGGRYCTATQKPLDFSGDAFDEENVGSSASGTDSPLYESNGSP